MEPNQREFPQIPEGPLFDVLSRLSIRDLHRCTGLSGWRDVFIDYPYSRKILPQTLQGFFYIGCDCRSHGHGGDEYRDSGAEADDDYSGTDKEGDCSGSSNGNSSGGSDRGEDRDCSGSSSSGSDGDDENEDCSGNSNSNSSGGSHSGEDGDCSGNGNSSGGSDGDDENEDCSGNSNSSSSGSDRDEDEDCSGYSNSKSGGSDRDEEEDCTGNSNSSGSDWDEDEDDSSSSSSNYGGGDSACSGNYRFHFLDLLANSMPVPDDTDTELSFIPPAHFGRIDDLLCSCNGLLLFGCTEGDYIVCNPATKQWKTVPTRVRVHPISKVRKKKLESTFLFFDPVVPSRFLLIQFWHVHLGGGKGVHTYSSETGKWSNRSDEWMQFASGGQWGDEFGFDINSEMGSSFLNGMLHFCLDGTEDVLIVAVDGEGCICRIMQWPPDMFSQPVFMGQSQGRLRCISAGIILSDEDPRDKRIMHVDVLRDYDAEECQIKKTFDILGGHLSGGEECRRL